MDDEPLGIAEARKKLGNIVSRAVHARVPVAISRSKDEIAYIVNARDYDRMAAADRREHQRVITRQQEITEVRQRMAAADPDRPGYTTRQQISDALFPGIAEDDDL